jgi:hypothetical protein
MRNRRLSLDWWAVIAAGFAAVAVKIGAFAHVPW